MQQIQLGLCNPPEPIYLFVGKGESDTSLWYHFDIVNEQRKSVFERAIAGYIRELKITSKEYKCNSNMKLDIVVECDRQIYVVRSGLETYFSKTFLLAIALVKEIKKPLMISPYLSDKGVIFCNIYNFETLQKVKSGWDKNADWAGIIAALQQQLGQAQSLSYLGNHDDVDCELVQPELNDLTLVSTQVDRKMLMQEIESLMKRKNMDKAIVVNMMKTNYGKSGRAELSDHELVDLRDRIALWQPLSNSFVKG